MKIDGPDAFYAEKAAHLSERSKALVRHHQCSDMNRWKTKAGLKQASFKITGPKSGLRIFCNVSEKLMISTETAVVLICGPVLPLTWQTDLAGLTYFNTKLTRAISFSHYKGEGVKGRFYNV